MTDIGIDLQWKIHSDRYKWSFPTLHIFTMTDIGIDLEIYKGDLSLTLNEFTLNEFTKKDLILLSKSTC